MDSTDNDHDFLQYIHWLTSHPWISISIKSCYIFHYCLANPFHYPYLNYHLCPFSISLQFYGDVYSLTFSSHIYFKYKRLPILSVL